MYFGQSPVGDTVALLVCLLAVLLPIIAGRSIRASASEHAVLALSTLTRVALCTASALEVFLPPVSDSLDFHMQAAALASGAQAIDFSSPSAQVFTGLQSLFYGVLGPSLFLAYALGILAFSAAGLVFLLLARRIHGSRPIPLALFLFCFGPSALLYANFNYREPFQILALLCAIFFALRYRATLRLYDLALAALSLLLFAAVHGKFFVLAPVVLLITIFAPGGAFRGAPLRRIPGILVALASTALFLTWMDVSMSDNEIARAISTGSVGDYVAELGTTAGGLAARTTMPFFPTGGSSVDLLATSPLLLFQYTFAPLAPWLVSESQDLVALADTLIRLAALTACLLALRRVKGERRHKLLFLLFFFLATSFVASLGTWTVGTAMRHQIKASWALLIVGAPVMSNWMSLVLLRRRRGGARRLQRERDF